MTQEHADTAQDWSAFALLLVDVQNDFWTDEMAAAFPDYAHRVTELLTYCRQKSIDVVHLRAAFQADRSDWMARYQFLDSIPCIEGTTGAQVLPYAAEEPGEKVITKNTFDAFLNSELQTCLKNNNKRFILIAGIETSVCVLLTAATAAQEGYLVALVEDCCADQLEAHQHTLERYPFIFSRTTVDQLDGHRNIWMTELGKLANH